MFSDTVSLNTKNSLSYSEYSDSTFLRNFEMRAASRPSV